MRIISGSKKSILINVPKNLPVRPTTDKVKESLFNILENRYDFDNCSVLDVFSGTGNLSYEFSSRGCLEIDSIDNNQLCINFINKRSNELNLKIKGIKIDYRIFFKKNIKKYDIIFADPPYKFSYQEYIELIKLIEENNALKGEGTLIIEHSSKIKLIKNNLEYEDRSYGSTSLTFIKKQAYKPDSV